jgi:hypothetical protein
MRLRVRLLISARFGPAVRDGPFFKPLPPWGGAPASSRAPPVGGVAREFWCSVAPRAFANSKARPPTRAACFTGDASYTPRHGTPLKQNAMMSEAPPVRSRVWRHPQPPPNLFVLGVYLGALVEEEQKSHIEACIKSPLQRKSPKNVLSKLPRFQFRCVFEKFAARGGSRDDYKTPPPSMSQL